MQLIKYLEVDYDDTASAVDCLFGRKNKHFTCCLNMHCASILYSIFSANADLHVSSTLPNN